MSVAPDRVSVVSTPLSMSSASGVVLESALDPVSAKVEAVVGQAKLVRDFLITEITLAISL